MFLSTSWTHLNGTLSKNGSAIMSCNIYITQYIYIYIYLYINIQRNKCSLTTNYLYWNIFKYKIFSFYLLPVSLNFKHQRYVKFIVLQIHLLNKYILDTNMIPEFLCHSIQVQTQYVKLDLCKSIFTKDNELAESFSPVVQCTSHHTSLKNFFILHHSKTN